MEKVVKLKDFMVDFKEIELFNIDDLMLFQNIGVGE